MKITIFTHMTNPEERMDPWREAISCYEYFADDVVKVGKNWPYEFHWREIGQNFQEGFDNSFGDWVINMSLDMFFHENSKDKLLEVLHKHKDEPAIATPKFKFFSPKKYEFKNFEVAMLNKKKFPNLKLNGGGDLCLPTLNGLLLDYTNVPIENIPIWNYDTTFRTKKIIAEDRARFARAWYREFDEWGDRGGPEPKQAFDAWFAMVEDRLPRHINKINIEEHPKFILKTLESLNKNQFGYDCFGLEEKVNTSFLHYIDYAKLKIRFPNMRIK